MCEMSRLLSLILSSLAILASAVPAMAQSSAVVQDVRVGFDGSRTRVVISASEDLDYSQFALSSGGLRYVLDFDRLTWDIPNRAAHQGEGEGAGGIQRFRYAHNSQTTSRLVFDLDTPLILDSGYTMEPSSRNGPYQIVLDFRPVDMETFRQIRPSGSVGTVQAVTADPMVREPAPNRTPVPTIASVHTIVIDPGHGGRDPGTQGVNGTQEKDVNLRAAEILRDTLERTGRYDVVLTRDGDEYIDHDRRIEIARGAGADLFISIHADAAGSRSVAGASVYTLSAAGDRRMERMREGGDIELGVPIELGEVDSATQDILEIYVQRETLSRSDQFANLLVPELENVGPILRNSHRQANFHVLLAPDVPAVLLEVGFLTNPNDERRLASREGLVLAMGAVHRAIDTYFENEAESYSRLYSIDD